MAPSSPGQEVSPTEDVDVRVDDADQRSTTLPPSSANPPIVNNTAAHSYSFEGRVDVYHVQLSCQS
ncbi:hypothetical protein CVT26_011142 [Gymnopilus dilepis]|uniref:Uncharacterized protein n=1 Tax=Gymnopilus dilepis TaxID=231916 RepID=A0A409VYW6_9AGAR|nr:hypothetical protein CVT26_011142 [Gymnopilus dilepis]